MEKTLFDVLYNSQIKKAIKGDASIEFNRIKGKGNLKVKGSKIDVLVTLGALENELLKKLNCSDEVFNLIKEKIGTEEV